MCVYRAITYVRFYLAQSHYWNHSVLPYELAWVLPADTGTYMQTSSQPLWPDWKWYQMFNCACSIANCEFTYQDDHVTTAIGSRDKTPLTKCHCRKPQYKRMRTPTPKPQPPDPEHKSVAFHTLAFCPWHSDRIPVCHCLFGIYCVQV